MMSALPPKADICSAQADVRFTLESGHVRCISLCPLCAKSGHWRYDLRKQKDRPTAVCRNPSVLTRPSLAQADLVSNEPEVEKEFRIRVLHRQTKSLAGTPHPPGAAADRHRGSALLH